MNSDRGDVASLFRPGPAMRSVDWLTFKRIARAPWILYLVAGSSAGLLFLSSTARDRMLHPQWAVFSAAVTVAIGIATFVGVEVHPSTVARHPALLSVASVVAAGGLSALSLAALGPSFAVVAVTVPQPVIFAFMLFTPVWATGVVAAMAVEVACVFAAEKEWAASLGQWIVVVGAAVAISLMAGALAGRLIESIGAEREARAELADLNATLHQRVDAQVAQLERAGRLERFLPAAVADAVLSDTGEDILRPHRRRIAVFFVDLRGFTAFASQVEPEDVIDVLSAYYRIVGEQLTRHGATVGSFAGDGIMAYLNDPVPCDEPASTVVRMAKDVHSALGSEVTAWRKSGFDLSFGIGVALGHATLGIVGYEGREDYTALGTVVNLAARLCSAAEPGQILLDPRTAADMGSSITTEVIRGLQLKGFPRETEIHSLRV